MTLFWMYLAGGLLRTLDKFFRSKSLFQCNPDFVVG